ncbi:MAG TPA: alpha-L-fucosidase [Opitutaceae bacterium]|nr:alpha-L-fucosidase [Opitutaceae bacterium]HND61562.1 alpha-L-fucosidase [Opitutaceae bacterium]
MPPTDPSTQDQLARSLAGSARDPLRWWREARFGLFIHWGLYAIPAGRWKGKSVGGIGEWIMFRAKIPVPVYSQLAKRFHPRKFNAAEIVRLAKDAGQRYLVITAKHHDGFAMYHSTSNPYNVVDATPWHHDPMVDLARECRKQGVRLCFYYSQDLDWHHPDGAWNTWDYDEKKKNTDRYLREKVFPQLRELLTNYGPVGLIWFDTPLTITRAQSAAIRRFVKKLQPACLVSGRIGHGLGDYGIPRDNQIPPGRARGDWEVCATLNHTWGFRRDDHQWKPAGLLIQTLVESASKNSNYLLNIGPDALGRVPGPSAARLRTMGRWLKANGESIYGAGPSPFAHDFPWGRMTTKGRTVYLHFFTKPAKQFELRGLNTRVLSASPLLARGTKLAVQQSRDTATGLPVLKVDLSKLRYAAPVTVVALKLAAKPEVVTGPIQEPDGSITLLSAEAAVKPAKAKLGVTPLGFTVAWKQTGDWLEWNPAVLTPGAFRVEVVTTYQHLEKWSGGHTARVDAAGQTLRGKLTRDAEIPYTQAAYFPRIATDLGQLRVEQAGPLTVKLHLDRILPPPKIKPLWDDLSPKVIAVRLLPVK